MTLALQNQDARAVDTHVFCCRTRKASEKKMESRAVLGILNRLPSVLAETCQHQHQLLPQKRKDIKQYQKQLDKQSAQVSQVKKRCPNCRGNGPFEESSTSSRVIRPLITVQQHHVSTCMMYIHMHRIYSILYTYTRIHLCMFINL